ncbi:uncharacterized protein LOC134229797 isoform X1 [Saccostrea cucullata]|uniref:uncharacterized protein LOC134229797 isoform X1 n=1 Tax=Saccostrea cuccullata TaxID=36930 RepID=UPI002ED29F42
MDGRVIGLLGILCLLAIQAKAHSDGVIKQTEDSITECTCMKSDRDCKQIKNKCEAEVCSVRDAFECKSCGGDACDCVYSVLEDRVAEVCVMGEEGGGKKRGLKKFIKKIKEKIKKKVRKIKKKLKRIFQRRRNRRNRSRQRRKNDNRRRKPETRRRSRIRRIKPKDSEECDEGYYKSYGR